MALFTAGLDWHLNSHLRWAVNFITGDVDGPTLAHRRTGLLPGESGTVRGQPGNPSSPIPVSVMVLLSSREPLN